MTVIFKKYLKLSHKYVTLNLFLAEESKVRKDRLRLIKDNLSRISKLKNKIEKIPKIKKNIAGSS